MEEVATKLKKMSEELAKLNTTLQNEREKVDAEKAKMKIVTTFQSSQIQLNVGGAFFSTSLVTLQQVFHQL